MYGPVTSFSLFEIWGARWPNGRVSDTGARGHPPCCVLEPSHIYSQKVLGIHGKRWILPDVSENLLTGTLSINTNEQTKK